MQEHCELPRYRHYRPLPGVLAAPLGDLFSVAPEIRVLPEWPQDVVSASHQEPPQELVAVPGDAPLGIATSRLVLTRHESRIGSHRPTVRKARGVLNYQHEGQRGQWSNSLHLLQ